MARGRQAKARQGKNTKKAVSTGTPHQAAPEVEPPSAPAEVEAPMPPVVEAAPVPVVEPPVERVPPFFRNADKNFVLQFGNNKLVEFKPPFIIIENLRSEQLREHGINAWPGTSRAVEAAAPPEEALPGPSTGTRPRARRSVVVTPSMLKFTGKMKEKVVQYIGKLKKGVTTNSASSNDNSWISVFINDITNGGVDDRTRLTIDDVIEWFRKFAVFTPEVIRNLQYHCELSRAPTCATGIETSAGDLDDNDVSMVSYSSSSSDSEEDEEPQSSFKKKPKTT